MPAHKASRNFTILFNTLTHLQRKQFMNLHSAYHLTQTQIEQFRQDGYIKLKDVLDAETLAHYGSEITRLTIELNTQHLPLQGRSTYDKALLQVMNL